MWCNQRQRTEEANQPIEEEEESFTKSNSGPNQVSDKLESWSLLEHRKELIKYANTLKVTKRSLLKLSTKVFDSLSLMRFSTRKSPPD